MLIYKHMIITNAALYYSAQQLEEMLKDASQSCFVNREVLDRFRSFGGVSNIILVSYRLPINFRGVQIFMGHLIIKGLLNCMYIVLE